MVADSYTRGGWAKLDQSGAAHLADIIATFPKSKARQYAHMLLSLYASIDPSGCITIGRRQLAEKAGVSERVARYFLQKLEDDGALVTIGSASGKGGGRYVKRAFFWLQPNGQKTRGFCPTDGQKIVPPMDKKPGDFVQPMDKNPSDFVPLKIYTEYIDYGGAPWLAPGARPEDHPDWADDAT